MIFCVENNAAVFFLQTINYRLSGSRGKTTDFDNIVPCKLFDHENVSNSNTLWHLKRFGPQDFMNMKKKKVLKLYLNYKLASLEKMCFFFFSSKEKRLVCECLALCLHHKKPSDGT